MSVQDATPPIGCHKNWPPRFAGRGGILTVFILELLRVASAACRVNVQVVDVDLGDHSD
jgi:hypothetical protein